MTPPRVALALAPQPEWLARLEPLFELVDGYSVTPETLWRGEGAATPNGFHQAFAALQQHEAKPFVAHSAGYSMAGVHPDEARRRAAWIAAMRRDHDTFGFEWWTDHAGLTAASGENLALPLPVPMTPSSAAVIAGRLAEMRAVGPRVGIEIHLAGGANVPAGWAAPGRTFRLNSHDHAVPEPVWALLAAVLPRCPGLRAVTLERVEGSVQGADVSVLARELLRIRGTIERGWAAPAAPPHDAGHPAPPEPARAGAPDPLLVAWEALLVAVLRTDEPRAAVNRALADQALPPALRGLLAASDLDGLLVAAKLVVRLRFERLLHGSPEVDRWSREGYGHRSGQEAYATTSRFC